MSDNRHVLLLVLADTCGACIQFKKNIYPSLKNKLESQGKVRIMEVKIPNMVREQIPTYLTQSGIPSRLVPEVVPYIEWFPNLLLVSGPCWNRGERLEAWSFNGRKTMRGWEGNPSITLNEANVLNWVNSVAPGTGGNKATVTLGSLAGGQPPVPQVQEKTKLVPTLGTLNIQPRHF